MTQVLSESEKAEFTDLRKFFTTYVRSVDPSYLNHSSISDPEDHLQFSELDVATKAELEGLKQGVNTLLYLFALDDPVSVAKADRLLTAAGAPLLSDMQNQYRARIENILLRGYIESETEFYLVREVADDNPEFYPLLEQYEFGPR